MSSVYVSGILLFVYRIIEAADVKSQRSIKYYKTNKDRKHFRRTCEKSYQTEQETVSRWKKIEKFDICKTKWDGISPMQHTTVNGVRLWKTIYYRERWGRWFIISDSDWCSFPQLQRSRHFVYVPVVFSCLYGMRDRTFSNSMLLHGMSLAWKTAVVPSVNAKQDGGA